MDKTKIDEIKNCKTPKELLKTIDELDLKNVTGGASDALKELEDRLRELLEQSKVAEGDDFKVIQEYIDQLTKLLQEMYGGNGGGGIQNS